MDNINQTNNQTENKLNKRKFYQYWRFWFIIFLILVCLIWVAISILLAYLNSRKVDISQLNSDQSVSYEKMYSSTDPSLGNPQASLQIVEFSDFQCPYCAQAHSIIKQLLRSYPNDVYFIYRDFPIIDIHPQAQLAAEAAQCAFDQEKFWEYHDLLFQNQDKLDLGYLLIYAQRLNLDLEKFTSCLEIGKYRNEVQQDMSDAYDLGVRATPTFFINGQKLEGVVPYETWLELINISKK